MTDWELEFFDFIGTMVGLSFCIIVALTIAFFLFT